jgi:uroporphyrinogen-III synthase
VTIICGDQARPNLVAELTAQGCRPVPLVMYHNRPPADLARDPIDLHAAIYHSPSAAQRQLHANPWLRHVPAVAVGKTTAAALQSGDHQQVIIAQSPAIAAIIAAVESL